MGSVLWQSDIVSRYSRSTNVLHTVRPFDRVVDCVFTPFFTTGVAKPLLSGATVLRAARLRSPWVRLRANRRDAMEVDVKEVADVLELKILR
jgi:hypothetical protein